MEIEKRVSDAVLQQPVKIKVGDKTYTANQPSTATLIMASKEIAKLPNLLLDESNILFEAMNVAKDCHVVGDVLAIFILGAKYIKEQEERQRGAKNKAMRVFNRLFNRDGEPITKEQLADDILLNIQPKDLVKILNDLLSSMQIAFFFGIITSLNDINVLKVTKKETTQSGQSSQE